MNPEKINNDPYANGQNPLPNQPYTPPRDPVLPQQPTLQPMQDIDDSAFNDTASAYTAQPAPAMQLPVPQRPAPIAPMATPLPATPPTTTPPQEALPPSSIPRVPQPIIEPVPVAYAAVPEPAANAPVFAPNPPVASAPPATPQPVATPPVAPQLPAAAPIYSAPPQPAALPLQPAAQPQPLTTPTPASYSPEPKAPLEPINAQPMHHGEAPMQHIPPEIAARIGEVPLQNSKDVQHRVERNKHAKHFKGLLSFLVFIGGVLLAAYVINQFIFQSFYVSGVSMAPTLQHNDRLIVSKIDRTLAQVQGKVYTPARGDIIILDSSLVRANGQHEQLIKRVVGLPGDTITISGGTVSIKNAASPEGFNVDQTLGLGALATTAENDPSEFTVSDGEVFVMGDNRAHSYDSRNFGPIKTSDIAGKLWARIFPLDKAHIF